MRICIILLLTSVLFTGCYTLNLSATPSAIPISLSNLPQGRIIRHFTISKTVHHLIYGLVTLNEPQMAEKIEAEVKSAGGSRAINLKVKYQESFIDGLVSFFTWGIYEPWDLVLEGDVAE